MLASVRVSPRKAYSVVKSAANSGYRCCRMQSLKSNQSSGQPGDGAKILDSNAAFAGKLLVGTLSGAAAVKWGSLLIALPFEPNQAVAILMVSFPVLAFAFFLWQR
jgi:hypothetical protein